MNELAKLIASVPMVTLFVANIYETIRRRTFGCGTIVAFVLIAIQYFILTVDPTETAMVLVYIIACITLLFMVPFTVGLIKS